MKTTWKQIEEEFDETFPKGKKEDYFEFARRTVKDFIHSKLTSLLQEIREGVGKLEKDEEKAPNRLVVFYRGKNEAISEAITAIKNIK